MQYGNKKSTHHSAKITYYSTHSEALKIPREKELNDLNVKFQIFQTALVCSLKN